MTDYHPLIARAVEGLAKNTGEARRALYERARSALVAQLRSVEPALSESDITKERLALEEAIRKVESEAARKALAEPRPQPRSQPRTAAAPAPRSLMPEAKAPSRPELGSEAARESAKSAAVLPEAERAEMPRAAPQQPAASEQHDVPAESEAPSASAKASARSRILGARTSSISQEGLNVFRKFVKDVDGLGGASAKVAPAARDARDSYAPASRVRLPQEEEISEPHDLDDAVEPQFEEERYPLAEHERLPLQSLEPSYDMEDVEPMPASRSMRPHPPRAAPHEEEEYEEEPRPPRSYRGLVKGAALLIIAFCVVFGAWAFRSNIEATYHAFTQPKPPSNSQPAQTTPPTTKNDSRVPQEQLPGQQPPSGTGPNAQQQAPAVAQRAVLYEADPNDPKGKRFAGSVVWRTETVSPGPGLAPELVVRADISIPERHMNVTWSLRRNTDKALPASHTIEIMFNLPPDFPGGGISNVPGILMKDSEEVRGMPLAGLAVKVTNGFFLIGLNSAQDDMERNLQLLKERSWFDILIVYNNGSRAILTLEKGPPGEKAFADAFAAWGQ